MEEERRPSSRYVLLLPACSLWSLTKSVQGCGKGYDVAMLALHGFDVYGLEVSATGVSVAREYVRDELAEPQTYNFGTSWKADRETTTGGEAIIILGDFFKLDWENGTKFDLI